MKRFTDTMIWEKEWFMELSPAEKIAWFYIKDKCDNVGVWSPNFKLAKVLIGEDIDWPTFIRKVNGNIEVLNTGKWFMIDFCDFQYGELSESCKPHKSYIDLLKKHRLLKGYRKGMHTLQEKDKEKDLEKDKEKDSRIDEILTYFCEKTGSKLSIKTEALRAKVRGRLSEGYTVEDCKRAVAYVYGSKIDNPDQRQYIRIETIFAPTKFPGYLDAWHREMK